MKKHPSTSNFRNMRTKFQKIGGFEPTFRGKKDDFTCEKNVDIVFSATLFSLL
jgi:hypothetical protein